MSSFPTGILEKPKPTLNTDIRFEMDLAEWKLSNHLRLQKHLEEFPFSWSGWVQIKLLIRMFSVFMYVYPEMWKDKRNGMTGKEANPKIELNVSHMRRRVETLRFVKPQRNLGGEEERVETRAHKVWMCK